MSSAAVLSVSPPGKKKLERAQSSTMEEDDSHRNQINTLAKMPSQSSSNVSLPTRHFVWLVACTFSLLLRISLGVPSSEKVATYQMMLWSALRGLSSPSGFLLSLSLVLALDLALVKLSTSRSKNPCELSRELSPSSECKSTGSSALDATVPKKGFDSKALQTKLDTLCKDLDALPLDEFVALCLDVADLISCLSKTMSFAASAMNDYSGKVKRTVCTWPKVSTTSDNWSNGYSIQMVLDREVSLGVANTGGKKNPSVSRSIQRLLWVVSFVRALLQYCVIDTEEEEIYASAVKAYQETLGKHHGWTVQTMVKTSMKLFPPRSSLLKGLQVRNEAGVIDTGLAVEQVKLVLEPLTVFDNAMCMEFSKRDLSDIK